MRTGETGLGFAVIIAVPLPRSTGDRSTSDFGDLRTEIDTSRSMAFVAALAMDRCESEQRLPLAERSGSPSSFRYKEGEERLMVEAANAASNFVGYLRKSWPESLRATVSPLTYRVTVPRSNRCEPGLPSREHDRK